MPSPPFLARELNGETLLEELRRMETVRQPELNQCALALRPIARFDAKTAAAAVQRLASGQPQALANVLNGWAAKLKGNDDVPLLVGHFERLALVSALNAAARQGNERLQARGARP